MCRPVVKKIIELNKVRELSKAEQVVSSIQIGGWVDTQTYACVNRDMLAITINNPHYSAYLDFISSIDIYLLDLLPSHPANL